MLAVKQYKDNMVSHKYTHSKDQSAEILRQTLPLMSKQSAALHPVSYAVWYEYVSGTVSESETDLQDILQNTGIMKESVGGLKNRLDESQSEIESLRVELVRAREEAMTDALTGPQNRKGFERRLAEYLGPGMELPEHLSLMMLDIDHFKRVNDTFGHLFGDKVIRAVAQVIKSNIKGQDIGVRYGGEEFLVFLPETSIDGALRLAEKLRSLIASGRIKRTNSDETVESVTISIGVVGYRPAEAIEALIGRADAALYISKSNGRNRVTAAADTA